MAALGRIALRSGGVAQGLRSCEQTWGLFAPLHMGAQVGRQSHKSGLGAEASMSDVGRQLNAGKRRKQAICRSAQRVLNADSMLTLGSRLSAPHVSHRVYV